MTNAVISCEDSRWQNFIIRHPQATIFHHPAWINLLTSCYHFRPFLFTATDEQGQMMGGLPMMEVSNWLGGRRVISLPFSDFCKPLVIDPFSVENLVTQLSGWRKQHPLPSVEVRWPFLPQEGIFQGDASYQHITCLEQNTDHLFHQFKKTQVQQCIRQAEKAGVTIRQVTQWEDVQLFYRLHLITRRRLGTPVQPLRYFRLLWERLISQGLGFVLLAYQGDQLLAGAIFLHWNKTLTYKYSASDSAFWNLRPNNLILWHAILWGCAQGYQIFDWGRTDLEDVGLRDFKRGWGSEEQLMHYSILADCPPAARISSGRARRILKTVIQHSPVWVCRSIGELFYGQSA